MNDKTISLSSNTMSLDEAIRRIGLKMEVRKRNIWSPNQVMWAEIGEIQTLLDWIADRRSVETNEPPKELREVAQSMLKALDDGTSIEPTSYFHTQLNHLVERPAQKAAACPSCEAGVPKTVGLHYDESRNASWPCTAENGDDVPC